MQENRRDIGRKKVCCRSARPVQRVAAVSCRHRASSICSALSAETRDPQQSRETTRPHLRPFASLTLASQIVESEGPASGIDLVVLAGANSAESLLEID